MAISKISKISVFVFSSFNFQLSSFPRQQVVSAKMDKTVVVRVTRQFAHPKYGKRIQKNKKFYAHDEENECKEGDIVIVEADTPKSKLKRWKLKEVVEKAVVKE